MCRNLLRVSHRNRSTNHSAVSPWFQLELVHIFHTPLLDSQIAMKSTDSRVKHLMHQESREEFLKIFSSRAAKETMHFLYTALFFPYKNQLQKRHLPAFYCEGALAGLTVLSLP